jgi:hypothetical protein
VLLTAREREGVCAEREREIRGRVISTASHEAMFTDTRLYNEESC